MSAEHVVRVAAVQTAAKVGDLAGNLAQAETLATEALERGARIVALPEFFTTPCFVHPRVRDAIVATENPAREMLLRLARGYGAYLGGSMLTRRDGDVYNTYCLAGPDGGVQTHDKDLPTMWENAFYVGGSDDGVVETDFGTTGLAVCWELIRWRTVKRFAGRIRYAITGNQWWSLADNWPGARSTFAALGQLGHRHHTEPVGPTRTISRLEFPRGAVALERLERRLSGPRWLAAKNWRSGYPPKSRQ